MLHALLIGIDRYDPNPWCPDLHGAVADVVAMRGYLLSVGVPEGRIRCLVSAREEVGIDGERPTWEAMVRAMGEHGARAAASGEGLLIHYSGHGGRVKTWLPGVKGRRGKDEGLVPCDVAPGRGRILRDIELTFLLDELVRRGVAVTVLLDACHSGGMLRSGVRGLRRRSARGLLESTTEGDALGDVAPGELSENRVAPLAKLERVWRRVHHRSLGEAEPAKILRHGRSHGGWVSSGLANAPGVVVVSACRSRDYAYERDFGDGPRGALTWHLLEGLERDGCEQTWETMYRRLVRQMRGLSPPQRPIFEGDAAAFGAGLLLPTRDARSPGRAPSKGASGGSGVVDGWSVGSRLALRPRRLALLEDEGSGPGAPARRGVLRDGGRRRGLAQLLRRELARRGSELLTWAEGEATPDLLVRAGHEGLSIAWADGRLLPGLEPCAGRGATAVRCCVAQLEHVARFLALRELGTVAEGVLGTRLGVLPEGYSRGARLPAELARTMGCPRLPAGRWIALDVSNHGRRPLFVTVLDLRPDWAIERLHPRRGVSMLDRGRRLRLPFELFLPAGHPGGHETLLVLATYDPSDFESLEQSPVATTTAKERTRRGGGSHGRSWRGGSSTGAGAMVVGVDFEVVPENDSSDIDEETR